MKNSIVKILCVLLALSLSLGAFAGCSGKETAKKKKKKKSSKPSTTVSDLSDTSSDIDFDAEEDADEFEDWEDEEDGEEPVEDDEFAPSEEEELVDFTEVSIDNTTYTNEKFRGIGYIHQMFSHQINANGVNYTEKQKALELDTMKKMNIKTIRAYYGADYSWIPREQRRSFETEEMLNFYQSCRELAGIGCEIGITAQYALGAFLHGSASYNSMKQFELSGLVTDSFDETCRNYQAFMRDTVLAFKAHGVNNIKYMFAWTECHNMFWDGGIFKTGDDYQSAMEDYEFDRLFPIYDQAVKALDQGLKDAGLRNNYKIVGPLDNSVYQYNEIGYSYFVKHCIEELPDIVDIIGSHCGYAEGKEYTEDVFYDIPQEQQASIANMARAAGKEVWIDETNVAVPRKSSIMEESYEQFKDPQKGVAVGAFINGVLNYGNVDNLFMWTLYDEQWPDNQSGSGTDGHEFWNGIQCWGYLPCLFESTIPRTSWYSMSLLSRYIGAGKIYGGYAGIGLYGSAIERDDGEITVVVTNVDVEEKPINVKFAKSVGGRNFYRYCYDVSTIEPTQGNEMIQADAVAEKVTTDIYDTMPACSVFVYSTQKN